MSYRKDWDLTRTMTDDKTSVSSAKGSFVIAKTEDGFWTTTVKVLAATTDNRRVVKSVKNWTIETTSKMVSAPGEVVLKNKKFNEALEAGNQKIGMIPLRCSFAQLTEKSAEAARDHAAFADFLFKEANLELMNDAAGYEKFLAPTKK